MKYYVNILVLANTVMLMGSETVVTVMPFSSSGNVINSNHNMNEHVIPSIDSLSALRNFIEDHEDQHLLHSLDYLKEKIQVLPQVFAEHYLTKHAITDPTKSSAIESKITAIMNNLSTSSPNDYYQHILNLVLEHKPLDKGNISFRNKPAHSGEGGVDPVRLLDGVKSLESLVTEEFVKDNQDLKDKNTKKDFWAKGYQAVITLLTVVSVVVPVVQEYWGNPANPAQSFLNCSHI